MPITALVSLLALGPMNEGAPPAPTSERVRPAVAPIESTDVFVERTRGYFAYRIPALETTPDGTLLAIAKDRSVGVLWEREADRGYQAITFTRLTREFLEPTSR
jgi:hypothetical protein